MLREIAAVATACALFLGVGFELGIVGARHGPLVEGKMENSSVNITPQQSAAGPCREDGYGYACVFFTTNGTLVCKAGFPDVNDSCRGP